MRERLVRRDRPEILAAPPAERAAARREHEPVDLPRHPGTQALGDGGVLGVDGNDLTGRRRPDDQWAADDEGLLVRQGQRAASPQSGERRLESGRAVDTVEDDVGSLSGQRARGGRPHHDPDAAGPGPLQRVADGLLGVLAGHADDADPQPCGLLGQQLGPATLRGEGDDTEPVGVAHDDVDGLGADRPGRAEQNDAAGGGHAADSSGSRLRRLRRGPLGAADRGVVGGLDSTDEGA